MQPCFQNSNFGPLLRERALHIFPHIYKTIYHMQNRHISTYRFCTKNHRNPESFGVFVGVPGAIRTRGLSLRRRTLYPAELRRQKTGSAVCKPSSVLMTIYLRASSPMRSSDTAEADGQPYVPPHLAPDGVYMTDESPGRRCALTAPFHPYQITLAVSLCCTCLGVASTSR